jgi:hypothetical protein
MALVPTGNGAQMTHDHKLQVHVVRPVGFGAPVLAKSQVGNGNVIGPFAHQVVAEEAPLIGLDDNRVPGLLDTSQASFQPLDGRNCVVDAGHVRVIDTFAAPARGVVLRVCVCDR